MKINYTFRTKTVNVLGTEMCNELQERMNNFTGEEQVEEVIWKLTYNPVEISEELGIPSENFDEETFRIIRNEIGHQFRNIWNDWNFGNEQLLDSEFAEQPAYVQLKKALRNDVYALYTVVQCCEAYKYMDVMSINKTLACLRSTWSTSHDKAFKRLGFNEKEQEYLLDARKAIADFLELLCKEKFKRAAAEQPVYQKEIPLKEEVASKTNEPQKVEKISENNVLSPSELIDCQNQIKAFYIAYDNVKMPEWLIDNRAKIEKLFEAYEQF